MRPTLDVGGLKKIRPWEYLVRFVFGGLAVLGIPTVISGAMSAAALPGRAYIPEGTDGPHTLMSYAAVLFLVITGITAWLVLYRAWKSGVGRGT